MFLLSIVSNFQEEATERKIHTLCVLICELMEATLVSKRSKEEKEK